MKNQNWNHVKIFDKTEWNLSSGYVNEIFSKLKKVMFSFLFFTFENQKCKVTKDFFYSHSGSSREERIVGKSKRSNDASVVQIVK